MFHLQISQLFIVSTEISIGTRELNMFTEILQKKQEKLKVKLQSLLNFSFKLIHGEEKS